MARSNTEKVVRRTGSALGRFLGRLKAKDYIFLVVAIGVGIAIFTKSDVPDEKKEVVVQRMVLDHKRPPHKIVMNVHLTRHLTLDELKQLSSGIQRQHGQEYRRTFINYFLPGMTDELGSWALASFAPNNSLEVMVHGFTPSEFRKLNRWPSAKGKIIGAWVGGTAASKYRYALIKTGIKYVLRRDFVDGGSFFQAYKRRKAGVYENVDHKGDLIVINPNGDLEFRDDDGLTGMAFKIRR